METNCNGPVLENASKEQTSNVYNGAQELQVMENAGKNLWKMQVIEFVSKEDLQVMESVSINHSCYNSVYHQLRVNV